MHFGGLFDDFNSKEEQGEAGENKVHGKILKNKDKLGKILLYHNLYIELHGVIYQIDHVLVTINGIFVIETKAVRGKVYGDIDSYYWKSYAYGNEKKFQNPLMQNKNHVEGLKNYFGNDFVYHSVVVFSENNKPENLPANVVNIRDLPEFLLSFNSNNKLSEDDMNYLLYKLKELANLRIDLGKKHKLQRKTHRFI